MLALMSKPDLIHRSSPNLKATSPFPPPFSDLICLYPINIIDYSFLHRSYV